MATLTELQPEWVQPLAAALLGDRQFCTVLGSTAARHASITLHALSHGYLLASWYRVSLWSCCTPAVIPARQPHLLDGGGDINRQLLERSSNPLVFTSLVLKTALGSYIQVRLRSGHVT